MTDRQTDGFVCLQSVLEVFTGSERCGGWEVDRLGGVLRCAAVC